jgi:hypothetical protein
LIANVICKNSIIAVVRFLNPKKQVVRESPLLLTSREAAIQDFPSAAAGSANSEQGKLVEKYRQEAGWAFYSRKFIDRVMSASVVWL